MLQALMGKIFGTSNDREIKKYLKRVASINALESKYEVLSDDELKSAFLELKKSILNEEKTLDDALVDSFAITREASKRVLNMRHFDVQLIGGMVLHEGRIAEMKTGEGKTLVATLAIVLNAMTGKGVHLVTVNDYLASRDAKEMGLLYEFLGFSVGVILEDMHDAKVKKEAYNADITYGTNNEFGFDYLRDNMSYSVEQMAQRNHNFVIVDEVDSILIDEARTPLIISGPTNRNMQDYNDANSIALQLVKDEHFTVDEKDKVVLITEDGITRAEELFQVENLYSAENSSLPHALDQALKANYLFEKDVDYVVNNGEVVIVDEFTGRLSEGRRYSEGLHQALEAKEKVEVKEETQTLADITFQNYFRMYDKLAGMTGTAETEATEFAQIYSLDVVSIPTNIPISREDLNDLIYKTEEEKFSAVVTTIKALAKTGQPVLIGTASIEKSEKLHEFLKKEKIAHTVLNAKNHEQEGEIIKSAGQKGAVTIATNMAGRGVDIKVNDEVKALGGLYIIGTERHENRRIDNQLRGRSGRQGDAGKTQFYLSLEDNLLRIFGSDKIKSIMERLGVEDGEYIESKMVTRAVEKAQKKVENMHYEGRKQIVEYDDVANEQRKIVYKFRNQLLNPEYDIATRVNEIRETYLEHILNSANIFDGGAHEDFNLKKVTELLKEELNFDLSEEEIASLEYDALLEKVIALVKASYDEKMSALEEDVIHEIERELYLKELDSSWREHLYAMDNMKTGIRLRAYNQKDPLVEYKKESYNLFSELINDLKFNTIKTLQVIQFKMESAEDEAKKLAEQLELQRKRNAEAVKLYHSSLEEDEVVEKKPARNEPCPCGSGKKYKQCCGISGPKKGAFAS
ncbi:MAG: preprotein translocase subunit SecA [Epsilonproteobacteria bacterium]|nr:preprotein translocase subunit SecA [Campylobacterota bacterium]PIP11345.1 MAG: preprotein translocase subunit SecA [Sulfurimonas sp. CG23_combo_of_CG06-09_8_20_14_all_36_33]PIS24819.1 MAG: preprotein translocase subunit SecA [Sulfurimonas sp. CG08_land_8_20_14_0_20_36_33]PIU35787.1 MAG: preprotein translocase subunit SecA [Sulfurimonas sp. CG07_land_8_20_14_0_80_36_56]PIV03547.1 MAG: preprotein translocase subunit SecA [Sulfurimonas sp. CG03_land_8_20_14_0_80_36_25]PIV36942.1 MAG: preprote